MPPSLPPLTRGLLSCQVGGVYRRATTGKLGGAPWRSRVAPKFCAPHGSDWGDFSTQHTPLGFGHGRACAARMRTGHAGMCAKCCTERARTTNAVATRPPGRHGSAKSCSLRLRTIAPAGSVLRAARLAGSLRRALFDGATVDLCRRRHGDQQFNGVRAIVKVRGHARRAEAFNTSTTYRCAQERFQVSTATCSTRCVADA